MRTLLDMDGVIVDFIGGLHRKLGVTGYPYPLGEWNIVPSEIWEMLGYEFWRDLEPMVDADAIVSLFPDAVLCSTPCQTEGCMEGKMAWIKKWYPQFKSRYIFTPVKDVLANPNMLLVDDSDTNLARFSSCKGNVLPVPRPWNSFYKYETLKFIEERISNGNDQREIRETLCSKSIKQS